MSLTEKIKEAFSGREIPEIVLDVPPGRGWFDSDEEDALWFCQRDWRALTWTDWTDHYCGIFFFTPEAFAYYVPSIMTLSVQSPRDILIAAQSVLIVLAGDHARPTNFLGLRAQEREALKEWLIFLRGTGQYDMSSDVDIFDRALAAVDLFDGGLTSESARGR